MIFIGREQQLQELQAKLSLFGQILISGPPGSGKTTLVKKFFMTKDISPSQIFWLNFGSSQWPYSDSHTSLLFEDYFLKLFEERLCKYRYIVIDQAHKLSPSQFTFVTSFLDQLMTEHKFIILTSTKKNFFENQVIHMTEMTVAEAEKIFSIYFPHLSLDQYKQKISEGRYFPQEILLLPSSDLKSDLRFEFLNPTQLKILHYLSTIEKTLDREELKELLGNLYSPIDFDDLEKQYLIRSNDTSGNYTVPAQIKSYFLLTLSDKEKRHLYETYVANSVANSSKDPLLFKYYIFLDEKQKLSNFLEDVSLETINQLTTHELIFLADYLFEKFELTTQSLRIKQKSLQIFLLSGQRERSIRLAELWLQEWTYSEKLNEQEESFLYELIHLLNRSDRHESIEKPLQFYLNRFSSKYKSLLRLETVLVNLQNNSESAVISLERILKDYTDSNHQLGKDEKKTLAHIYFQLARAENISQRHQKSRNYYQFAEQYYNDCGLTYYASISYFNYSWSFLSERNFAKLEEAVEILNKKYCRYGFLLTRFGYEILSTYISFFNLNRKKTIEHLNQANRLLKNDIPSKPRSDFLKLNCFVNNFYFSFGESEKSYQQLSHLLSETSELKQSANLIGRPESIEKLVEYWSSAHFDWDFVQLQLLMMGLLDLSSLNSNHIEKLKKSLLGDRLFDFLNTHIKLDSQNFPKLLKHLGFEKSIYTQEDLIEYSPYSKWSGYFMLTKYFSISQREVLTKSHSNSMEAANTADLFIDDINREVYFKGTLVEELQRKGILYRFLKTLVASAPSSLSKESLALSVWGEDYDPFVHDNRIYTSTQRIRNLIGSNNLQQIEHSYRINPKLSCAMRMPDLSEHQFSKISTSRILEVFRSLSSSDRDWISKKDLSLATGLSDSSIKRGLNDLIKENLILKRGEGVHTVYKLK